MSTEQMYATVRDFTTLREQTANNTLSPTPISSPIADILRDFKDPREIVLMQASLRSWFALYWTAETGTEWCTSIRDRHNYHFTVFADLLDARLIEAI